MIQTWRSYPHCSAAFARLRTVKNGATSALVAEYAYNGLNHRVGWHSDTDSDGDVDASDPWYWQAHDERWRVVAVFRGASSTQTDAAPKEQYVYHAAGLNGTGGSSYIDLMVLREKDSDTAWGSASDGTLEERRYSLQNWRADVSAVLDAAGDQVERVKYSAYGVPFCVTPADFNADGSVTTQDNTDFTAAYNSGTYDPRCDLNLDGLIDFSDWLAWLNEYNGGEAGGRGVLSRSSNANRAGYAGYRHAPEIKGSAAGGGAKWHVRHRVLDSETGRWTRRDPIEYAESSLYSYANQSPLIYHDSSGLAAISYEVKAFIPGWLGVPLPGLPWTWASEPFSSSAMFSTDDRGFGQQGSSRLITIGQVESTTLGSVTPSWPTAFSHPSHRTDTPYIGYETLTAVPDFYALDRWNNPVSCSAGVSYAAHGVYPFIPLSYYAPHIKMLATFTFSVVRRGVISVDGNISHTEFPFFEILIDRSFTIGYNSRWPGPFPGLIYMEAPYSFGTMVGKPTPPQCFPPPPTTWKPGCRCLMCVGCPCPCRDGGGAVQ